MARHTLAIFVSLLALVACNSRPSTSSDERVTPKTSVQKSDPQPTVSDVQIRTLPTLAPQAPEEVVDAIANAISQEKAQLLVRVLLPGGKPAVGATVTLLDGSNTEGITGLSDADGLVHFAELLPGSYQLWATDSISISSFHTLAAFAEDIAQPPVDLQLGPATLVSGRIRSFDLGVQATLSLVPIGHDHAIFRTQSKPDGSFLFPAIPRGKWESRITALQHSQPLTKGFTADSDKVYVDLQVVANAAIEGAVVDASNTPIADARIRITTLGKTQRHSSLELLQSQGSIRWTHPLPGVRTLPKRDSQRFGAKRPGIRPAECGAGHCGVDLGGKRGWPILAAADGQVVVASDDDRGKTGRYVVLAHRGGLRTAYMHMDAVTADLRVGQTVPAGTTLGTLGRSGILRSQPHLHFALSKVDQGQTLFIDPEPMLRFAVVRPETAMVSQTTEYIGDASVELGVSMEKEWTSRADGSFAKNSIPPGKYRLQVLHPDYAPGTSVAFVLRPGQYLKKLRIILKQGNRHEGQVVGPDGPVLDAWVRAYQGEGESRHRVGVAQVDELGRFVMRPLLGQISLEIGGAGYGVLRIATNLNKKTKGPKLYTLSRFDAHLRGQLRAPNGTPLVSAQVQIVSGPAGRGRRAHTDAYGFFQFDLIPGGDYRVRFRSDRLPEMEVALSSKQSSEFTMIQGGSLSVSLEDKHGRRALPGLRVLATGPEQRTTTLLSDSFGKVLFGSLLPGTWTVSVDSSDFTPIEKRYEVSPAQVGQHTLALERGASLTGILYDANGDRAANAKIWLGKIETKSDANGVFHLTRVPIGKKRLRAKLGTREASLPLELFAGDELVTLEMSLGEEDSTVGTADTAEDEQ